MTFCEYLSQSRVSGIYLKLYLLIDRKLLLKQPYSKLYNMMFRQQELVTKEIMKSVYKMIMNLKRQRKTVENTKVILVNQVYRKILTKKMLKYVRTWRDCGGDVSEFSDILIINLRILFCKKLQFGWSKCFQTYTQERYWQNKSY